MPQGRPRGKEKNVPAENAPPEKNYIAGARENAPGPASPRKKYCGGAGKCPRAGPAGKKKMFRRRMPRRKKIILRGRGKMPHGRPPREGKNPKNTARGGKISKIAEIRTRSVPTPSSLVQVKKTQRVMFFAGRATTAPQERGGKNFTKKNLTKSTNPRTMYVAEPRAKALNSLRHAGVWLSWAGREAPRPSPWLEERSALASDHVRDNRYTRGI